MAKSITSGQERQYERMMADVAKRALEIVSPDKEGMQRLLGCGDELRSNFIDSLRRHLISNQFASKEVPFNYGYFSGYNPKPSLEDNLADLER